MRPSPLMRPLAVAALLACVFPAAAQQVERRDRYDPELVLDTGGRTVSGGVIGVPSFPGDRGLFRGAGTAGQDVILTLNAPTQLISQSNPLDTITVNSMTLDNGNSTTRTIGVTGVFQVGVGGNFGIAASQPAALYKADFDLTADYQ